MTLLNKFSKIVAGVSLIAMSGAALATTDTSRPNILAIWGDDIGQSNISAYTHGMMGYQTKNIDRIANEGALFTDYYGENSCTAGRAAFITGQYPVRTGLTKVGLPGSDVGLRAEDVTIAELLKDRGYTTGQFGKNHLGDKDEFLPTNHGFDEFFGNLYHLNAEEEPEHQDYPKDPAYKKQFGPRGVLHTYADGRIEDTGPLTKKRMETVDDEFLAATTKFIDKAHKADKPFFVWFNSSRMHVWTHLRPESEGISKRGGLYGDGMMEHDYQVGVLLDKLDELNIADNTIVLYSTDNGAETFSWPDGGSIPFKGEKNTTWEGGFRVPAMVRWPNKIPAGQYKNEIASHMDWAPTFLAAAGVTDIKEKLKKGTQINGKQYKVHLDGYNMLPYLTGETDEAPRPNYMYFTDGGDLSAIRVGDIKLQYSMQECHGLSVWMCPLTPLRAPLITNLRQDPYERARDEAGGYDKWYAEHMFEITRGISETAKEMRTFVAFPPRQVPPSWSVDGMVKQIFSMNEPQY
ncbi:arylsulfatase [Thalassotalea psychrophila]|uniref:Arylsulfatase n=1 Tax=Thalassotalea psychrophila TaxID=3065647 RepID=A0ABY9TP16_9GAMM|nr:arylsulfatase [Colwelliaceae bacterium SQ149]